MSTRATYVIENIPYYIHYDGYPEGAAGYLGAAVRHENKRGGMAAQFIRANDLAEFTGGHGDHGDTEHQYTLTGTTLMHRERVGGWDEEPTWRVAYKGPLSEFLNRHEKGDCTYIEHDGRTTTIGALRSQAQERLNDAVTCLKKGWIGNGCSSLSDAWRLVLLLPEAETMRADILKLDVWFGAQMWEQQYGNEAPREWLSRFRPEATPEEVSAALQPALLCAT